MQYHATVIVDKLHVRQGPGLDSAVSAIVLKGDSLHIRDAVENKDGRWLFVTMKDRPVQGWVKTKSAIGPHVEVERALPRPMELIPVWFYILGGLGVIGAFLTGVYYLNN